MTEEEYNLDLKAQQRERQQRLEQHLQTIEKSLDKIQSGISFLFYVIVVGLSIIIGILS